MKPHLAPPARLTDVIEDQTRAGSRRFRVAGAGQGFRIKTGLDAALGPGEVTRRRPRTAAGAGFHRLGWSISRAGGDGPPASGHDQVIETPDPTFGRKGSRHRSPVIAAPVEPGLVRSVCLRARRPCRHQLQTTVYERVGLAARTGRIVNTSTR